MKSRPPPPIRAHTGRRPFISTDDGAIAFVKYS